jgi:hypothetical protein
VVTKVNHASQCSIVLERKLSQQFCDVEFDIYFEKWGGEKYEVVTKVNQALNAAMFCREN